MNTGPLALLSIGATLLGLAILLFAPSLGLVTRWRRRGARGERTLVEDALKHLWDCEYRRIPASLQSLAGTLALSVERAASLVARLERLDLVVLDGASLGLTDEGRRDALRVIRIHRLWERYLADETGLAAREWHAEAERREHRTTFEQAEALAARLGDPRFDPHGDPIPSPTGELPPPLGMALGALAAGQTAEIVHVEDEPEAVYARLAAAGLGPGVFVRALEISPRRVRLETETGELELEPLVAANVTVVPISLEEPGRRLAALSDLHPGERAEVVGIARACRGAQRRRLLDLGVLPGTVVASEFASPAGDPTAYRIRGALVAMRRDQADLVRVRRLEGAPS